MVSIETIVGNSPKKSGSAYYLLLATGNACFDLPGNLRRLPIAKGVAERLDVAHRWY